MWDKIIEKAVNIEAKTSLQLPFGTKKINSKYPKGYRPLVKKNKDNTSWEYCNEAFNKDKNKAKSHNSSFANQFQIQASKKDKRGCWGGHLAIEVNITKVVKKNKDKAKDLSHVKCYTCKQKGHYINKCLKKLKN